MADLQPLIAIITVLRVSGNYYFACICFKLTTFKLTTRNPLLRKEEANHTPFPLLEQEQRRGKGK